MLTRPNSQTTMTCSPPASPMISAAMILPRLPLPLVMCILRAISYKEKIVMLWVESNAKCDERVDHWIVEFSPIDVLPPSRSSGKVYAGARECAHWTYKCCDVKEAIYAPDGDGTAYWHAK